VGMGRGCITKRYVVYPEQRILGCDTLSFIIIYNLKSFLILPLAVDCDIFSKEKTKYLKKDMR